MDSLAEIKISHPELHACKNDVGTSNFIRPSQLAGAV